MPQTSRPRNGTPSFPTLLLRLLRSFSVIAVPLAAVALIPPSWGLALIAALFASTLIAFRFAGRKQARAVLDWTAGAALGLGLRVWLAYPAWWGLLFGAVVVIVLFSLQTYLEHALALELPRAGPEQGPCADDHFRHRRTPDGKPLRFVDWGELWMGGGVYHSVLFPDGVVLQGIGHTGRFSRNGHYFAAVCPSRGTDGLVILDRQARRVHYDANQPGFWALRDFTEPGARHDLDSDTSPAFREYLSRTRSASLIPVGDLWLEPEYWSHRLENITTHEYASPDARHKLVARHFLPASLLGLDEPLAPLHTPEYALNLDGRDAGLLTDDPESVSWRVDSLALVCRARPPSENRKSACGPGNFWLWENGQGWRSLPPVWVSAPKEPGLTEEKAAVIDKHELRLHAVFDNPELGHGSHGHSIAHLHDKSVTLAGHDEDGGMRLVGYPCRPVQLHLPLGSAGGRGAAHVESCEFQTGGHAEFTWVRDSAAGLGAWRCRIGDWNLPGLWLLDHRVSDDGRHIALCPFPETSPAAETFSIATPAGRQLRNGPDMLISCLYDFHQEEISVVEIASVVGQEPESGQRGDSPLNRYQAPAPAPSQAEAFLRSASVTTSTSLRHAYRLRRFRIGNTIDPLPSWRTVQHPQAAFADGDFVFPSPGDGDAAWYFGSRVSYGTGWPPKDEPRGAGCLLTASGCAVDDLAPPMLWSEDGRFLALCRLLDRPDGTHRRQWRLLLLDPAYGMLHVGDRPLGGMPVFKRFDAEGLTLSILDTDWRNDSARRKTRRFSVGELTGLPAVALVGGDGLRLTPDQEGNRALWETLDTQPLAPYRTR